MNYAYGSEPPGNGWLNVGAGKWLETARAKAGTAVGLLLEYLGEDGQEGSEAVEEVFSASGAL